MSASKIDALLVILAATFCASHSVAAEIVTTDVNIVVEPYAAIDLTGGNQLYLEVPPSKSTVNTSGAVNFTVSGNARATLSALPSDFVFIPGADNGWMGRATKGADEIGYQVQLTFPNNSILGSLKAVATLPLFDPDHTVPVLSVPLPATNGQRGGTIDLLASAEWTPTGLLPLPGIYIGEVILTVTAENIP